MNNEAKGNALLVRELTWLSALIALQMILGRLEVGPNFVKFGFGFIATALIGYYYGPITGAIVGVVSDIVTHVIFPDPSGFFWGFTLSALVAGLIYGLVLHEKKITYWRALLVTVIVVVIVNTLMNTLWISMMMNFSFWKLLAPRLIKEVLTVIFQSIVIWLVLGWVDRSKFRRIK
ncbi:membrane protein [Companilactobacillus sp. RD055328]|uniref:folate family ECF transporter S component n=1 Tax=Companilactobacillus sp. RD055328 TaxID=2916634 RepID=UPI001FC83667|nr:folate family ECF transporter S component [Companilactobacillus sp. RD055328]GKQ42150.1 membrane protein [Companilactobacillus sp. RD055328]